MQRTLNIDDDPTARTRFLARLTLGLALGCALLLVQGCASLPPPVLDARPSVAIPARPDDVLSRVAAQSLPEGANSGFRPLPQSDFSMDARLTLARHAQKSLDIQYYLLQNDVTGHKLLRAVRDAAARGVRVRLLVDDLYTADSDRMLLALAAYPNIEVRLFNPFASGRTFFATRWAFSVFDFARVNRRMHNKMFIADGAFAVAGGRNIADEYFFHGETGNFIDFDLLIAGDAVPRMAALFDAYWNSRRVYPLHALETGRDAPDALQEAFGRITADAAAAYPTPPPTTPDMLGYLPLSADIERPPLKLLHGRVDVFADNPEKAGGRSEAGEYESTVTYRVLKAMSGAKSELALSSPYFIPGETGMEGLRQARAQGVRVSVVTNTLGSNDEPLASAAYARYRVPMLKLGVELSEIDSHELKRDRQLGDALRDSTGRSHAKLVVIDRRTTFVGSMNMDLRSARSNTEVGLLIDSPALAKDVMTLSDIVRSTGSYRLRLADPGDRIQWISMDKGSATAHESDPDVNLLTRIQTLLLSPFVSEGLL